MTTLQVQSEQDLRHHESQQLQQVQQQVSQQQAGIQQLQQLVMDQQQRWLDGNTRNLTEDGCHQVSMQQHVGPRCRVPVSTQVQL